MWSAATSGAGDSDADVDEELPIHPGYLKTNMTVLDLTAYPRPSRFLTEAKLRGCSIISPATLLCERVREHVERIGGKAISVVVLQEKLTAWLDAEEDS